MGCDIIVIDVHAGFQEKLFFFEGLWWLLWHENIKIIYVAFRFESEKKKKEARNEISHPCKLLQLQSWEWWFFFCSMLFWGIILKQYVIWVWHDTNYVIFCLLVLTCALKLVMGNLQMSVWKNISYDFGLTKSFWFVIL